MYPVEIRKRLELTQAEFALLVGADVRTIARWEAGSSQPSGTSKQVIAAILAILQGPPENEAGLKSLLSRYACLGGLAYMVFDLLERSICLEKQAKN